MDRSPIASKIDGISAQAMIVTAKRNFFGVSTHTNNSCRLSDYSFKVPQQLHIITFKSEPTRTPAITEFRHLRHAFSSAETQSFSCSFNPLETQSFDVNFTSPEIKVEILHFKCAEIWSADRPRTVHGSSPDHPVPIPSPMSDRPPTVRGQTVSRCSCYEDGLADGGDNVAYEGKGDFHYSFKYMLTFLTLTSA
ncbi:hypothetical protein B0H16DRAFT_1456097 [Mycena metata]|uniref:Uncharacterized protein n=1 Tax=Mycena metata TaxID=1033252 RepID=A0AAD7NGI8_9AGAR|nr:hypothetical protein B0H16DRAFT_1456097 [Mycena metata]